jgi:hypothetical protein
MLVIILIIINFFGIMKNQAKKMKESITFINAVDEEPLIFEEESKTQNLLREFDQSRTLDTGKF